jgi:hypothetical protein
MKKLILASIAFALGSPHAQAGNPTSGEKAAANAPGANVSISRCTPSASRQTAKKCPIGAYLLRNVQGLTALSR